MKKTGIHKEINNTHETVGILQLIQTVKLNLISGFAFYMMHGDAFINCIKINTLRISNKPIH